MLSLPRLWNEVTGPADELHRFRIELLWQEYARHWYARLGPATRQSLRYQRHERRRTLQPVYLVAIGHTGGPSRPQGGTNKWAAWRSRREPVRRRLAGRPDPSLDGIPVGCAEGRDWRYGEDLFFAHLLDGSRAANRLGWQIAAGLMSERPYAFSRWQVETRAPGLCASCDLNTDCPIDRWPDRPPTQPVDTPNLLLFRDPQPDRTAGPAEPVSTASSGTPDVVWITAESMGLDDPALAAHPDLPVVFVFDRPLLAKLKLSAKRLTFMVETLAELATIRDVEVRRRRPRRSPGGGRLPRSPRCLAGAVTLRSSTRRSSVPGLGFIVGPMVVLSILLLRIGSCRATRSTIGRRPRRSARFRCCRDRLIWTASGTNRLDPRLTDS